MIPTQKTIPQTSHETDYSAQSQLQKARIEQAKTNLHPLLSSDPLDRQAGVYAKGLRLISGPKFQKLPEDNKQSVLREYYQKYVYPAYMGSSISAPDEDTWIKGMAIKGGPSMTVDDFYLNRGAPDALADFKSSALNMGASAAKVLGNIIQGATIAGVKVPTKFFGLQAYFNAPQDDGSWKASLAGVLKKASQSGLMKQSQDTIDNSNFWFASRPTQTFSEQAGSFIGEQAAQLPLYESIGAIGKGLGAVTRANKLLQVTAASGEGGITARAANFTRRLAASPRGRFMGRRLHEAAQAYIGATLQNSSPGQRMEDVIGFMVFGAGTEGLGKAAQPLIRGSKTAMKKLIAEQAAIGGLPLVEAIQDQAVHELNNNIVGTGHSGEPLIAQPHHVPADITEGMGISEAADPVKHSLVNASKLSFITLAKEMYGENTVWKNLARSKQDIVRAQLKKIGAEATEEIAIHVPEVAKHEIEKDIKSDIVLSPQLAQTYADIEKNFKVHIPDAVAKQEREAIKSETGLKSVQGVVEKVAKKTEAVAKAKASGAPKPGPRTKEDQVFSDFSDFGTSKYNYKDESFNVQFASKADRALYNTRKTPLQYRGQNKEVPPTYAATKAKLKEYFPTRTDAEIQKMANEVKSHVDKAVKDRLAHPEYKAGTMKYGANIRVEPIHGEKLTAAKKGEAPDITQIADKKKAIMNDLQQQIEEYPQTMSALKANFPEAYQSGLDALVQMQAMKASLEMKK